MQHSQPHIPFYQELIFMIWGGRTLRKVKSPMIILFSEYLASLIPPSSDGINILLWSSHTENFNNNFGANFFLGYRQWRRKDNHFLLYILQLEGDV